jgi:CheY-like chemotaxis protein
MQQEKVMSAEKIRDKGQTLDTPTGKILGIVDSKANLEDLARAMESAGYEKVKFLSGEEGADLLERSEGFFFSDMEERVLTRHIEELKAGHHIISIAVSSDQLDEAQTIATRNGARGLIHFGSLMTTQLTK